MNCPPLVMENGEWWSKILQQIQAGEVHHTAYIPEHCGIYYNTMAESLAGNARPTGNLIHSPADVVIQPEGKADWEGEGKESPGLKSGSLKLYYFCNALYSNLASASTVQLIFIVTTLAWFDDNERWTQCTQNNGIDNNSDNKAAAIGWSRGRTLFRLMCCGQQFYCPFDWSARSCMLKTK
jgi:hypothetical protein